MSQLIEALEILEKPLLSTLFTTRGDKQPIQRQTLAHWAKRGLLVPSGSREAPSGRRAGWEYTIDDLARARLIVQARAAGVSMQRIAAVLSGVSAERLRTALRSRRNTYLVIDSTTWSGRLATGAPPDAGGEVVLPLQHAVEGTRAAALQVIAQNATEGGRA
jgi:DNA-binding transcriptional MerR regulator